MVEAARERLGPNLETVIVSDHGFNHTEKFVNYSHLLSQAGFGREYLQARSFDSGDSAQDDMVFAALTESDVICRLTRTRREMP